MMKLVYEGSGAVVGSDNKVTCEVVLAGDEVWDTHLESFLHFLNVAGYTIDAVAIPEMVAAAQRAHQDYLDKRYGSEEEEGVPEAQPDGEGWIKFTANEDPTVPAWLHPLDMVEIKCASGSQAMGSARLWDWSIGTKSPGSRIEAYRMVGKWNNSND